MGKITPETEQKRTDRRYWLYETPEVYETSKNAIRYYEQAGKIQFACCDYVEATESRWSATGIIEQRKPGKLSALDLNALYEDQETLKWLIGILQDLQFTET